MENNPIINAGKLSDKYPSIIKLNGDMHCNSLFTFDYVNKKEVEKD